MDNPFVTKGYAAVRGLLDKDLITEDKGTYSIYDPFFALWIQQH